MNTIEQDIALAKYWANAFKLIEPPGEGQGWRHTCYRLAKEVERLSEIVLWFTSTMNDLDRYFDEKSKQALEKMDEKCDLE